MSLAALEADWIEGNPKLRAHPDVSRTLIRLGLRRLRPFRARLSPQDQERRICALRDYLRRAHGDPIPVIDPITISILLALCYYVASLLLQWWLHRRDAVGFEAAAGELVLACEQAREAG